MTDRAAILHKCEWCGYRLPDHEEDCPRASSNREADEDDVTKPGVVPNLHDSWVWKDGYQTGFAEGSSGKFNPDGSYAIPNRGEIRCLSCGQPWHGQTPCADATPNHAAEFHTVEFDTVKFYRATSYAPAMLTIDPSGPGETGASIGFNGTELQEFVKWIQGLAT